MAKRVQGIEFTRASSKGQIVIPTKIRKKLDIREGSVLAVATEKDMIVLKKVESSLSAEDLKSLRLVEEAWKDSGGFDKLPYLLHFVLLHFSTIVNCFCHPRIFHFAHYLLINWTDVWSDHCLETERKIISALIRSIFELIFATIKVWFLLSWRSAVI